MPRGIPKNGINNGWFKKGIHPKNEFKKGQVKVGRRFEKGHPPYNDTRGEKHGRWKGGRTSVYRAKTAPRPKPIQCEICGGLGRICYDHDHKTGKFRGWICLRCNVAIGMVKENTETLMALADYIKKSREV